MVMVELKALLRFLVAAPRGVAGVDGDEGDRRGATRQDVVEEVGQVEGADVGVGMESGAERPRDVGLAQITDDARQHDRDHQQQRGRQLGVLMGRTQVAQHPRPETAAFLACAMLGRSRHVTAILHGASTANGCGCWFGCGVAWFDYAATTSLVERPLSKHYHADSELSPGLHIGHGKLVK